MVVIEELRRDSRMIYPVVSLPSLRPLNCYRSRCMSGGLFWIISLKRQAKLFRASWESSSIWVNWRFSSLAQLYASLATTSSSRGKHYWPNLTMESFLKLSSARSWLTIKSMNWLTTWDLQSNSTISMLSRGYPAYTELILSSNWSRIHGIDPVWASASLTLRLLHLKGST